MLIHLLNGKICCDRLAATQAEEARRLAEEKSKTLLLEAAVAKTRVTCIETQTEQEEEVGNGRDRGGI